MPTKVLRKSHPAVVPGGRDPAAGGGVVRSDVGRIKLSYLGKSEADKSARAMEGQILSAAIKMFSMRGYDATSIRDLAKAVGIQSPGLYNYYASKADLLPAAADYILSEFYTHVLQGTPDAPASERLFSILRRHALYCVKNRGMAKAADSILEPDFMRRTMKAGQRKIILDAKREYLNILSELARAIRKSSSPVDDEVTAAAMHGIVDRAGTWALTKKRTPTEIADQCCRLVADLLGVPNPTHP